MLSGLLFYNAKGELLIQRFFRDDIPYSACETFRQTVIVDKHFTKPIIMIDGISFLYTRQNDVFIAGVTRKNTNPMVVFEFMISVISVFTAYFGRKFTEESIRNNFVVIYELLDEMMDNGLPQLTAINHLKGAISLGSVKGSSDFTTGKQLDKITSFITGGVDWREPGKHVYKKNEVYMDVLEAVNVLMSHDGTVLRSDVSGKIVFKTYLTGMPQCQFGLNDKLRLEKAGSNDRATNNRGRSSNTSVAIDDITFHRCVSLAQFEQDRVVSFIPPDGEFVLMKYRVANQVQLPFRVTPSVIIRGRTRVEYSITIQGNFESRLTALNVKVLIPTPPNTASTNMKVTTGKTSFKGEDNYVVWKIPKFNGGSAYTLRGEAILTATVEDKPWSKPPMNLEFQVPMFAASGMHVRFLRVVEVSRYAAVNWVRYVTRNGNYQIRI